MLNVRVASKRLVAEDILAFSLVSADVESLPEFSAGAHVDVHLPGGLVRQYSLCGDPKDRSTYMLGVLKDPASRGGSMAMHAIEVGSDLKISTPKNHFPLAEASGHTVLIAGGIGVTPILAMAHSLTEAGRSFEMHYCTRSLARTAFREEILGSPFESRVRIHLDDGGGEIFDAPSALRSALRSDTHIYVCGPGGFIDAMLNAARDAGYEESQLHREYFGAPVSSAADADAPFKIRIASSGATFDVPSQESVVEVLARHGIGIETSCEQGVCGTCVTRVLDGVPLHRDVYLSDEEHAENRQFTPCCSRSCSPLLILDL